jgi:phage terminase large subunit-like protein
VYDFEVPGWHNYVSGGLIHHNSESIGAYEMSVHLTGEYPHWWEGRRFDRAVSCWAAGDTGKTVRDILQLKLLGKVGDFGTGMIPGENLLGTTTKYGLPDAVESAKVRHVSGGTSVVTLKSYDQRRESFQGTEQDVIWLDEEPPQDIYVECLMRTMTTGGMIMCTFTPLMGVSEVVKSFMPGVGFSEVPH